MAKVEMSEFSDKEISRIFVAGSLQEAARVEYLLTENAISYAVEIEEVISSAVFTSTAMRGVAFYVLSGQSTFCRRLFLDTGLENGLVDDEE